MVKYDFYENNNTKASEFFNSNDSNRINLYARGLKTNNGSKQSSRESAQLNKIAVGLDIVNENGSVAHIKDDKIYTLNCVCPWETFKLDSDYDYNLLYTCFMNDDG